MLIVGAGNLGKHILEVLLDEGYKSPILFYDSNKKIVNKNIGNFLITSDIDEASEFLKNTEKHFFIGVGQNRIREKLSGQFIALGGKPATLISKRAFVSPLDVALGQHIFVQPGAGISHSTFLAEGCVIHAGSVIGHGARLGRYVSVATLSTIIGPCSIGDYSFIGTNCVVMPHVKIGNHAFIGAGVKVDRNVEDYETIV